MQCLNHLLLQTFCAHDAAPYILPNLLNTKAVLEQQEPRSERSLSVIDLCAAFLFRAAVVTFLLLETLVLIGCGRSQVWQFDTQIHALYTLISLHMFLVNYAAICERRAHFPKPNTSKARLSS